MVPARNPARRSSAPDGPPMQDATTSTWPPQAVSRAGNQDPPRRRLGPRATPPRPPRLDRPIDVSSRLPSSAMKFLATVALMNHPESRPTRRRQSTLDRCKDARRPEGSHLRPRAHRQVNGMRRPVQRARAMRGRSPAPGDDRPPRPLSGSAPGRRNRKSRLCPCCRHILNKAILRLYRSRESCARGSVDMGNR
jgi:hypothetical protein